MQKMLSLSRGAFFALSCAISLQAQCLDTTISTGIGSGDDVLIAGQVIPFAFPFNGSTYTRVHPCTNGFVHLSNGTTTGTNTYTPTIATMVAQPGPMIAPFWTDLNMVSPNGVVKIASSASKVVVTWFNAVEYSQTNQFTFQLVLLPSGEIDFIYGTLPSLATHNTVIGMSEGLNAVIPAASNFLTTGTTPTTTNFMTTASGPQGMSGQKIQFLPTSPGWVWVNGTCSATHTSYGTGCYDAPSDSFYQESTAAAANNLSNTAFTMLKTSTTYVVIPLGAYVPPSGSATNLGLGDDGETSVGLSMPFPYFGGSTTSLQVCSNGFVSVAGGNGTDFSPTAAEFLNAPQTAWRVWRDYNTTVAGAVKFEQVGTVAYITWDGVANFGGTVTDTSTWQFQFDCATGNVTYAFAQMSTNSPSTTNGTVVGDQIIGYSEGGNSADPGSISLLTALPITLSGGLRALALSADPAPISTPSTGTTVTYTISNIPELAPGSGVYVAMGIVSLNQFPAPGLDLAILGAPGCNALVQTIDFSQAVVGFASTLTVTLNIPAGVTPGLHLFSQAAALVNPFSLPNGQNAFGLTTSNGIDSLIDVF